MEERKVAPINIMTDDALIDSSSDASVDSITDSSFESEEVFLSDSEDEDEVQD